MADGSIEIRIKGSLDPSLSGSLALAKANVAAMATEVNKLAKSMVAAGGGTDAQRASLNLIASDLQNAQAGYKSLASQLKNVAAAAALSGQGMNEIRALFDEVSSGRLRNLPSTLAILAQRLLGLSGTSLAVTIGVGALTAGIAAYAIAAQAAIDKTRQLATGATLLRGFSESAQDIDKLQSSFEKVAPEMLTTKLAQAVGLAHGDAEQIVAAFNTIPDRTQPLFDAFGALVAAHMRQTGDDAKQAVQNIVKYFQDPSLAIGLKNITDEERGELVLAKQSEDAHRIQAAVFAALATNINASSNAIITQNAQLGLLDRALEVVRAGYFGLDSALVTQNGKLDEAKARFQALIKPINDTAAAIRNVPTTGEALAALAGTISASYVGANAQITKITGDIATMKKELAQTSSKTFADQLKDSIAEAQRQLTQIQSKGAGFGGQELIAQTQDAVAKINQLTNVGETERQARIASAWRAILNDSRLSAQERLEVERSYDEAIAQTAKTSYDQQEQIQKGHLDTAVQIAEKAYDEQKSLLDRQVAAGQISKAQEDAALQKWLQNEQATLDDLYTRFAETYRNDVVLYQASLDAKARLDADYKAKIAGLGADADTTGIKQQVSQWKAGVAEITSTEKNFISTIFSGRQTLQQALLSSFTGFIQKEIATDAAGLTERALLSKAELAQDQSLGQTGLLYHLLFESQKTAATNIANAARTASNIQASASGISADADNAHKTIFMDASVVFGNVFKWASPLLGPFAAVPAAAAYAAVIAKDVVGFEQGTMNVPATGLALLHKGEMVVPESFASGLRGNLTSINNTTNTAGGTTVSAPITIDFTANGAMTDNDIKRHARTITQAVSDTLNRHPALRPKY